MTDEQRRFGAEVAARLQHLAKTATMWGSPEELETVAQHFTHVWLASQRPEWTFEETLALWQELGTPLAADPDEHASMRTKLWGQDEERARVQVVEGFVVVWAQLERDAVREAFVGRWIETLLDAPVRAGRPDLLHMVLFALIGFVAKEPKRYVELLSLERHRIGGHPLRPFHVVAAPGPSEVALAWTRRFSSWPKVTAGIEAAVKRVEALLGG